MTDHTPPTDDELKEMQARCDAATPGPWKTDVYYVVGQVRGGRPGGEVIIECRTTAPSLRTKVNYAADSRHVAAARTDLPRLIAEVQRQREIIRLDWEAKTKPLIDDTNAAEQLDASDFSLRVGAMPEPK